MEARRESQALSLVTTLMLHQASDMSGPGPPTQSERMMKTVNVLLIRALYLYIRYIIIPEKCCCSIILAK